MPAREIEFTERHDKLIADMIDAGRFVNVSEAVTAGLRLLEQSEVEHKARIEGFRAGHTSWD